MWTLRYFVCQGGHLAYYRQEQDPDAGVEANGTISLEGAIVQALADIPQESQSHSFALLAGGKRHVLCAENDEERDAWVTVLRTHIEMMFPVSIPSNSEFAISGTLLYRPHRLSSLKPRLCTMDEHALTVYKNEIKTDNSESVRVYVILCLFTYDFCCCCCCSLFFLFLLAATCDHSAFVALRG